ncbi:MAG: 1-deoxy-D-xylulose-5-phosphate synthase [Marinilabiliales bacterium]|nr:1-deoxy-D-xylulose-5-phosphate synthase [Marinilabiliales bacterium]
MAKLLENIDYPSDLRKLKERDLPVVCTELRELIIREASCNPGHFGASMGVVELTVALHYVYNTPYDQLIWDVGHQAYGHKILTGRRKQFHTNRRYKGLSGFPNRSESEYDAFGVGHSSTSISAALGISVAAGLNGDKDRKVIAIIGDGSMTGGMAFEGLNNAGTTNADLLVVLNDNNMSIDPNVGGISRYLLRMQTSRAYNRIRSGVWQILKHFNRAGKVMQSALRRHQHAVKAMVFNDSNLFEALGFRYFGPVDGHDVVALTKIFHDLKEIPGPKLLHVLTKKGKGFVHAENDATKWHAPGKFNAETGEILSDPNPNPTPPKYQQVFGLTLLDLAKKNPDIVGVTPAMPSGCSMNIMMEAMPSRAFDVGIAEPHAVTFAAGMAVSGKLPFVNIYSSFMQRSYDQVIHDVALQKLNVIFCMDRGGLVGADGATHHGVFDLSYMRNIPNMTVAAPMDEIELRNLMYTAQLANKGPFAIRYPRGNGMHTHWELPYAEIKVGTGRKLREGKEIAIASIGHPGNFVTEAITLLEAEGITPAHYDMRFVKPLDTALLDEIASQYHSLITVEDGVISGGFGSAILEYYASKGRTIHLVRLGVPDRFVEQGTQQELYRECGFDAEGIIRTVKQLKI